MTAPNATIDNALFLLIEAEIRSLFNQLLARVIARRDELLAELHERWTVFEYEIKTRNNTLKDLEKMREHFELVSIKENLAVQIQEASLQGIEQQVQTLEKQVFETPRIKFVGSLTDELLERVSKLGAIVGQPNPIDYSKIFAVRTIGTKGSEPGQFNSPNRIFIDIRSSRLFVPDPGNRRVQILSLEGESTAQFGEDELKYPVSVVTSSSYCYVSDHMQNCIMRYDLHSLKFVNSQSNTVGGSVDSLKKPRGITASEANEVLVADNSNRICVFDYELRFKRDFGAGLLQCPQFIQLRNGCIFVLDRNDPCLHVFNGKGDVFCSVITRGVGKQIRDGVSFCFDQVGNVIVADSGAERVRVFSSTGELLHTICVRDTPGVCWGVAVAGEQLYVSKSTIDIF